MTLLAFVFAQALGFLQPWELDGPGRLSLRDGSLEIPKGCWAKATPRIEELSGEIRCYKTLAIRFVIPSLLSHHCPSTATEPSQRVQVAGGHSYRVCEGGPRNEGLVAAQERGGAPEGLVFFVQSANPSDLVTVLRIMGSYDEAR